MTPHLCIPLPVKLAYTAFVAVLVPVYWRDYGPTNFLYFCDVALLLTVVAVWRESSLLASIATIGIVVPQTLWMVDFLCELVGVRLTGMTGYMFDPGLPLFTRFLSFFHFWLPLFLLWLVRRLGYDRRALVWTTLGAWGLVLVCYFWMPPPPAPSDQPNLPVNINYVYGFGNERQSWMPQPLYLALMMVVLPAGLYLPAHLLLRRWKGRGAESAAA
ncbi:MAG: hypothetical protein QM775_10135 [Pirellulales bacterium]